MASRSLPGGLRPLKKPRGYSRQNSRQNSCRNRALGPNIVSMVKSVVSIRHASPGDAEDIAFVHDVSWRDAYRGVIPGVELERMIARRGPH